MVDQAVKPKASTTSPWIWLVLIITVALTAWTALQTDKSVDDETDLVIADSRSEHRQIHTNKDEEKLARNESNTEANDLIPKQALKREADLKHIKDLFPIHSWVVIPPAKKVKPMPPPPPVAPPAPFAYIGKLEDGPSGTRIFLADNSKVYSIAKGEKINNLWRLDNEDSNNVYMTFIPLNLPQVLNKARKIAPTTPQVNVPEMNQ
jgi:hypothetical protein